MQRVKQIRVIGGGPIGLEAALYARAAGNRVVVLETGDLAANVGRWGFVRLFSPWSMNTTPLGRKAVGDDAIFSSDQCPTAQEFLDRYLLPLAQSPLLNGCIDTGVRVLSVGHTEPAIGPDGEVASNHHHTPFRLLVCDRFGVEQADHADVVLDCSGTYGHFRWAGRGGVPAVGEFGLKDRICYTLPDVMGRERYRFAGRHTLLIGTGTSAATILMNLAALAGEEPETRVTWAFHHWGHILRLIEEDPLPQRRALVEQVLELAKSPPPWLDLLEDTVVEAFSTMYGLTAALRRGDESISRRIDEIIAAVGYRPDESIFEPLGVRPRYVNAEQTRPTVDLEHDSVAPGTSPGQGIVTAAPGYYILGAKSYGLNSNFLLRIGHAQVRDAFREIDENPQLDLYAGVA
jgi:hypothetical protein